MKDFKANVFEETPPTEASIFLPRNGKESLATSTKFAVEIKGQNCVVESVDCDNITNDRKSVNKDEIEEKCKGFCSRYAGILLSILSALMFSLGALIVKSLKGYHPFTLGVFRFQGILLPSIPLILYAKYAQKKPIFEPIFPLTEKDNWKTLTFLGVRGLMGCGALIFHFYALQYLSIADTMIIGSVKPVLVTLLAHLVLGERCGIFPIFVALLTICGVGVILRPPILTGADSFDNELLLGALFALGGVFTATLSTTIIRALRKVHFAVLNFVFGSCGTALCLTLGLSFGVFELPHGTRDILLAVSLAAVTFFVQTLFTIALQKEQAGPVSLVRTTETVFAFFWQFIFLGVEPDLYSLFGAIIVVLGVVLTTWSKWLSTLANDHPMKKKYFFVLK